MINFAKKRGVHPDDTRHALDCCAVLTSPQLKNRRDPQPISREHFTRLLESAPNPRMKAWLLCMLNLCMYPGEALNLDWDEIDLKKKTVVTERSKTHVIRVGVLWDRTIDALKAIRPTRRPQPGTPVFRSQQGTRWRPQTANAQFRALREAAGVPERVKAEQCRDGAYTAAVAAGVDLTQAQLLAGHATGISDYYAQRRPKTVEPATKAIERAYFG
ncbi:MAG: tyrosine-type recombinase/integrase [Phycisphaeraceae bacterium]